VNAVAELFGQVATELRRSAGLDGLQVSAAKVAWLVGLLRHAGDAHGVPLPAEVVAGIDGCARWAVHLAEIAPPSRIPGDGALVVGTLLDQAAKELGDSATMEALTVGAGRLADLLATVRQVAEVSRVRLPGELAGMIQGLNTWALDLAASWHGLGGATTASSGPIAAG